MAHGGKGAYDESARHTGAIKMIRRRADREQGRVLEFTEFIVKGDFLRFPFLSRTGAQDAPQEMEGKQATTELLA